jgi:flagellar protein FlbD
MIQLTRLNNKSLVVNADLIKFVEQSPDTLVTLITGEKIVVRETVEEVLALVVAFRRSVVQGLSFPWDASSSHLHSPEHALTGTHPPPPETGGQDQER